jgi:hypothetical protein
MSTAEPTTIECPACGKPIPLETHGRHTVARHDCGNGVMREVYDEAAPTQTQLAQADKADAAGEKSKEKKK